MKKILVTILVTNIIALCMSASIIDFISASGESRQSDAGSKNCICKDLSCICCLDFNISFIDLGGPGCVRMNYLSPEEGIALNVSYGESLLHNEVVKGPDPPPTCLNIFAQLAQMCARFKGLLPTDDGMKGCVSLEPMLLGEPQLDLPIGCFRMSPRGMEIIQSPAEVLSEVINEQKPQEIEKDGNSTNEESEGPDSLAGYTAEDILAAVNESAEQGIALISNWLGLSPNATDDSNADAYNVAPSDQQKPQYITEANQYSQESSNSGHVVFGS